MMADGLLALGLVLTTATQLRPGSSSVGPAEAMLVLWVLIAGARLLRHGVIHLSRPVRVIGGFWLVFVATLALGTMVSMRIEFRRDTISTVHDIFAYGLLLPVSCLAVAQDDARVRIERTAWLCVAFGNLMLAAQLANAYGAFSLSFLHPWYWDRLEGWSTNPNQLALLAAVLQFLALHVSERASSRGAMLAGAAGAPLPFIVGLLTLSDTFIAVCLFCSLIFAATTLRRWMTLPGLARARGHAAYGVLLAAPMLLLSLVPFVPYAVARADQYAKSVYNGTDRSAHATGEGATRLRLWREAVRRGFDSAGLGLGPGAHLSTPPYKREPPPKFEAHNTILDLFTQGGAIAVVAVSWLWGSTLRTAWRAHAAALTTLACAVAVFSMFHLIIRQPMFWFTMAIGLSAGAAATTPSSSRAES